MYELPTSITIQGQSFAIRAAGDYRMVLDCFNVLNDLELNDMEKAYACLIIFYDDVNSLEDLNKLPDMEEAIEKMYTFFDGDMPKAQNNNPKNYRLVDWEGDSMLISSAVNQVAGKEIRAEKYVHWWTFLAYYMAIGECALSTVVSIRYKIATGKALDKTEKKFKYENPQYFTFDVRSIEQQQEDAYVRSLWNSGKG